MYDKNPRKHPQKHHPNRSNHPHIKKNAAISKKNSKKIWKIYIYLIPLSPFYRSYITNVIKTNNFIFYSYEEIYFIIRSAGSGV